VAGVTISGRFNTFETVPTDTRALRATWRTLTVMKEFLGSAVEKSRKLQIQEIFTLKKITDFVEQFNVLHPIERFKRRDFITKLFYLLASY
jgi:hypothetical protein